MSECLQKKKHEKKTNSILNHNHIAQSYIQIYVWKSVIIANRNAVGRNPAGIQANNFSLCLCIVFNCKCAISLSYARVFRMIRISMRFHCCIALHWLIGDMDALARPKRSKKKRQQQQRSTNAATTTTRAKTTHKLLWEFSKQMVNSMSSTESQRI